MSYTCRFQNNRPYEGRCRVRTCPAYVPNTDSGCAFNVLPKERFVAQDLAFLHKLSTKKLQEEIDGYVYHASLALAIEKEITRNVTRCKRCKRPGKDCANLVECARRLQAIEEVAESMELESMSLKCDVVHAWAALSLTNKGVLKIPDNWRKVELQ